MKTKTQKLNCKNGLIKTLLNRGSFLLVSTLLFINCKDSEKQDLSNKLKYSYSDSLYFARNIVMNGCEPCHNLKSEPTVSKFILYDFYIMDSYQLERKISCALKDTIHKGRVLGVDSISSYHLSQFIKTMFNSVRKN